MKHWYEFAHHKHRFVNILVGSELRQRCKFCTAVRLIPNPGDSDDEILRRIEMGSSENSTITEDEWFSLVARMLQRQYERQTGLPAFAESKEYVEWLKNKKHQ